MSLLRRFFSKKKQVTPSKKEQTYKRCKRVIINAEYNKGIMTVTYSDGKTVQYKGGYTVWNEMPLMRNCSTNECFTLTNIEKYINHYGNPYPNAHKK